MPGKVGECIREHLRPKSFQGPKAGPGPWLKWACTAATHTPSLCSVELTALNTA